MPVLIKIKPKTGSTTLDPNSTQLRNGTKKVTSAEPELKVTDSGLLSSEENKKQYDTCSSFFTITSDSKSSDEDEVFTDSLICH